MHKTKSILPRDILDRPLRLGTWDQLIAEAELAKRQSLDRVTRLDESIRIFREQQRRGAPCPGSSETVQESIRS